ncbi:hypothetical protein [Alkalisalibacterium limincola]|uniref:DUF2884 family protein n=1 Tax=Alkalisalibacterium limincola TaxID=2699169 RepID=A0A5C8KI84_9GAMM|nr:hypothetical protein [Alkalisalibacterium limincola]TXK59640.1 hypothetical protein FU658_13425 [Alkalisalibacterium limincola]
MNTKPLMLAPLVALVLLAGCAQHVDFEGDSSHLSVRGDTVRMNVPDLPRATLEPDGTFKVAGTEVATTPAQRALLRDYHAQILRFGEDSAEFGKAAGGAAATAARDAVRAKFSGEADEGMGERIGQGVKDAVSAGLGPICDRIDDVYRSQRAVAESGLTEFQPYARMTPRSSEKCREGMASL